MKIGAVSRKLSTLSRKPPWPGIKLLLSFTPKCLLNDDSIRSPICENIERIIVVIMRILYSILIYPINFNINAEITATTIPDVEPDIVLPGLIDGASFGPPINFPNMNAPISVDMMTNIM